MTKIYIKGCWVFLSLSNFTPSRIVSHFWHHFEIIIFSEQFSFLLRFGIGCAYQCSCSSKNSHGCDPVTGECRCNQVGGHHDHHDGHDGDLSWPGLARSQLFFTLLKVKLGRKMQRDVRLRIWDVSSGQRWRWHNFHTFCTLNRTCSTCGV